MWLANLNIGSKLAVGYALVLMTMATATTIVGIAVRDLDKADTMNAAAQRTVGDIQAANAAHLDQAQAMRGYVLMRDDAEAASYDRASKAFADHMAAAKAESAGLPGAGDVEALIDKLTTAGKVWQTETGDKTLNLAKDPRTYAQALAMSKVTTDKQLQSGFRSIANDLDKKLTAISKDLEKTNDDTVRFVEIIDSLGMAGSLCVALLIGYWLYNAIAKPVHQMTEVMKRLAAGDNDVEVPAKGRKDNVGLMAEAVEEFRRSAIEKLQTEGHAVEAQRVAEKERALREVETDEQRRHSETAVAVIGEGLDRLARGDLTWRIETPLPAAADQLRVNFNTSVEKLQGAMLAVFTRVRAMQSGTQEIATAADDLSQRTEQQAASLEETAAALEEITSRVRQTAEGAAHASDVVAKSKSDAAAGGEIVRQAIDAVGGIEKSSQEISQIIGVIDEIAFQTNLLALNAGVEAARAGDAGRGFAVVASEVRALAQRSAEAAKEIKALISASTSQVDAGVQLVMESGKALERIVTQVADINQVVSEIARSAREQATGLQEVNGAVNAMDQVTQQNAAVVEQSTAATHTLAGETKELWRLLGQFKVSETREAAVSGVSEPTAAAARKDVRRAPVAAKITRSSRGSAAVALKPMMQTVAEESWEEF